MLQLAIPLFISSSASASNIVASSLICRRGPNTVEAAEVVGENIQATGWCRESERKWSMKIRNSVLPNGIKFRPVGYLVAHGALEISYDADADFSTESFNITKENKKCLHVSYNTSIIPKINPEYLGDNDQWWKLVRFLIDDRCTSVMVSFAGSLAVINTKSPSVATLNGISFKFN